MSYVDAMLHIADLPALTALVASHNPDAVSQDGRILELSDMPTVLNGSAALVYLRLVAADATRWTSLPGVTVLAEAPCGPEGADARYAGLFADPKASALYEAVYTRTPQALPNGGIMTPPERFGLLA
ncbi:MAG: hypothetical protein MUD11_15850 [Rhodobacteraceae bacterium]|nr:hypothetical protein [Paracoccaceae bacterium]